MARPSKQTIDYFPHFVDHKKTMFIIENLWGNDGYAFWFKLLELLGSTAGHAYDCNKPGNWAFLLAKTRLSEVSATEILNKLAELDAIDQELWEQRVVWSQNFVSGLEPVYKKRKVEMPVRPSFRYPKPTSAVVSGAETPQSKVKESRVEESKVDGAKAPARANKPPKKFVPPTLDEVKAYCKERDSSVDPKKFFDYFDTGKWVDSNGKPVRNWKQKLITWEGRQGERASPNKPPDKPDIPDQYRFGRK